jgi:hypothetical protein
MALAAFAPDQAHATPFVVNNGNDLDSNGVCDTTSCTLRDAVDATRASTDDDVIEISLTYILRKIGIDDSECYPVNLRIEGVGMGEGRVYDQDDGGALALASQAMEVAVHHGTFHLNTAGNNDDVARVEGSAELSYLASLLNGRCNGSGTFSTLGYSVIRVFGGGPQCQVDLGVGDVGPSVGLMFLGLDAFHGGLTRYHRLTGDTLIDADNVPLASCLAEDQRAAARPSSGSVCYAGSLEVP